MKRLWTRVDIIGQPGAYIITLDGKPHRTLPSIPFQPLAGALQQEWQNAPPVFSPDDLPLTRLAVTAAARVSIHKPDICRQLAAYAGADLLCHRAEEPRLAAREQESWQPWLDRATRRYGVALSVAAGIMPVRQPTAAGPVFAVALAAMTIYDLAALGVIVPALGSLILGLAVREGALSAPAACDLSWLEELWQEASWGVDDEKLRRRGLIRRDVMISARFMELCRA